MDAGFRTPASHAHAFPATVQSAAASAPESSYLLSLSFPTLRRAECPELSEDRLQLGCLLHDEVDPFGLCKHHCAPKGRQARPMRTPLTVTVKALDKLIA